jgi:hypothetical protein
MTNEQINISIAEACGWTEIDGLSAKGLMGKPPEKLCSFDYLPNYCNDLNAMHEAEKVILDDLKKWRKYVDLLGVQSAKSGNPIFHLTSRQKAEAFLRTLEKWEGAK